MTTIKVRFRPSSAIGHLGSIVYLVTRNRLTRQITTEYKLFPHQWDNENSMVIQLADPRLQLIARHIHYDVQRLGSIIKGFECKRQGYTAMDVVNEYHRIRERNFYFSFMESTILRLKQLNHFGTANNYYAALESIKKFREGEELLFDEIDNIMMEGYEAWMLAKGLTPNSTSFYMRILRAVYNRAVEQEITIDRKPFRSVFTGVEKTRKRAISLNEIRRICNLELSLSPQLEFARDIFIFLFYCRGMSFIDAAYLKKTDIKNGVLSYRRHKTSQLLRIKIEPEITEIIERYSEQDSPYLLPIISSRKNGEGRQYTSSRHQINNSLKKIGKIVGLHIPLTTYVSRHTWATIAKHKSIPLAVISEALGHNSEKTTQIYLASIGTSVIDQANEAIIKSLY